MQNRDQARECKPMYITDVWLWRNTQQNAFDLVKKGSYWRRFQFKTGDAWRRTVLIHSV